jgi:hypothetical protein
MAKRINESPTTDDAILFTLETPGADGLLRAPAKIERIVVSKIEQGRGEQKLSLVNTALEERFKQLRKEASEDPCQENILRFRDAKYKMDLATVEQPVYKEAVPIYTLGAKDEPIWTPDIQNRVKKTDTEGVFEFEWEQQALTQGDYTIQWTWVTQEEEYMSWQQSFSLSDPRHVLTDKPMRYTPEDKYEMLLNLYTPEMYKARLKTSDITPETLTKLNWVVAKGFTFLEDMANRLLDMTDPGLADESLLPLLANFFNLRLTSEDPTRWRRQILRATQLNKRKGTLMGLTEALDQAGIRLLKITRLWQLVSQYKWTDGFVVKYDQGPVAGSEPVQVGSVLGKLSRFPYTTNDIEIKIRSTENKKEFVKVPRECIQLVEPLEAGDNYMVIWQGLSHKPPIFLYANDVVLVTYKLQDIPPERALVEDYLLSLPPMDQSEPTDKTYPPKNWNTRVIEDDDPMFDILIKERQPFTEPVVFGKTRTTFLYSEKVYNMDTYDGSLRDSNNPCDIDKEFVDTCSYCQSSKFNADVEIENLSEERVREAVDIIKEYAPFHAQLHFLNISGAINEYIVSPIESVESLATFMKQEQVGPTVAEEVIDSQEITFTIEYKDGTQERGTV